VFTKILFPLLVPGVLAASILVLVRTVGMFDLTFLVSGPDSDTLVVAIYRAMTAAGGGQIRQLVSSMAVVYTVTMMVILIVALRYVSPTQLVARVKDSRED
jgi:putative spermidine/putrescine transport system permease protein